MNKEQYNIEKNKQQRKLNKLRLMIHHIDKAFLELANVDTKEVEEMISEKAGERWDNALDELTVIQKKLDKSRIKLMSEMQRLIFERSE